MSAGEIAINSSTTTAVTASSPTTTTTTAAPLAAALTNSKGKLPNSEVSANANLINKPAVPLKPTKLAIYATPSASQKSNSSSSNNLHNDAQCLSGVVVATVNSPAGAQLSCITRENILELVGLIESSLKHPVNMITVSQWLQLGDKLQVLHNSCVIYADNETMPPHSKFHFRELVTRIETQAQCLRTASAKHAHEYERLTGDVSQTLRQIQNVLHR